MIKLGIYDNVINSFNQNSYKVKYSYSRPRLIKPYIAILFVKKDNQYYFIANNRYYSKITELLNEYPKHALLFLDQLQLSKVSKYLNDKQILINNSYKNRRIYTIVKIFGSSIDSKDLTYIFKANNPYDKYIELITSLENIFSIDLNKTKSINSYYIYRLQRKEFKYRKYKLSLESNFNYVNRQPFTDVFIMRESRVDRFIYMLDINSLYPYLTSQEKYPNSKKLIYSNTSHLLENILSGKIDNGIFRVEMTLRADLSNLDREFLEYLPFEYREGNLRISFDLNSHNSVSCYLISDEIVFYNRFFDINVIEGTYSIESINHPQSKWVDNWYALRLKYSSDPIISKVVKSLLVSFNSYLQQNRIIKKSIIVNELAELNQYFIDNYAIDIRSNYSYKSNILDILDIKQIKSSYKVFYNIRSYDLNNNDLSIANTLYAKGRLKMIQHYYNIYKIDNDFKLAYTNIDSLHISIPKDKVNIFTNYLNSNKLISNTKLGSFKIEAIGNRYLSLDIGKYWLFKDSNIVKYKNGLPIDDYSKIQKSIKDYDKYGNVIYRKYNIFKNIRYHKSLNIISDDLILFKKLKLYSSLEQIYNNLTIKYYQFYKKVFSDFIR